MKRVIGFLSGDLGRLILGGVLFFGALLTDIFVESELIIIAYIPALIASGYSVFYDAVRGLLRRDFLGEKFLMSIASVGAFIIGEYTEGVAVMLFFLLGQYFEHKAVAKSKRTIRELMDICPDEAVRLDGEEETVVDADELSVGDTILIRAGERVPVDCRVIAGCADIDTSHLTGESAPLFVSVGDSLVSGSVVLSSAIRATVAAEAEDSGAQRIIALAMEATERKSKEETFISAFSKLYTPIVVALALVMALIPPIFKLTDWQEALYRALSFLVISCPCALVISVPMAFFAGIGKAASLGILFKGSSSFSPISRVKVGVFDKTGTLTTGKFKVESVKSCSALTESEILSLASSLEYASTHPIALAIREAAPNSEAPLDSRVIAGMGVSAKISGSTYYLGNRALMNSVGVALSCDENANDVYLANESGLVGIISLFDTVRPEAKAAILELRRLGVDKTVILSGDKRKSAEAVGKSLGIDEVQSELLPEEKYARLLAIIENAGGKTMYVGDGINDTPSLSVSDVGVAMGAIGTDSAKECADLVIMGDRLTAIPEAIKIARRTLAVAKENIIFSIGVKLLVLVLAALGIANMWLAVFADVGVCVIAVLNSMRLLLAKRGGGRAK